MPTAKPKPPEQAVPSRPKLLLIDGHSIAYRAFFALPVENFSTQTGQHTNGVFGFTSMLINVLRDEAPTHVGVAFDVSRQTFRAEIYPEYKANRSKTPDEFKRPARPGQGGAQGAQHRRTSRRPGFEADDVIGTLATQAEPAGFDVLICTGDRDAFQLVTDHVTVLYPRKGVSDLGPDDPGGGRGEVLRHPGALSRARRPGGGVQRQPARGCRASVRRRPPSGWSTYDGLENLVAHAGELKGKAAEAFQERTRGRAAQPPGQRPGPRPRPAGGRRRAGAAAVEPGGDPHRCSTGWSSGCCATGCWRRCPTRRWSPRAASSWPGPCWSPARSPAGWPSTRGAATGPAST